MRSQLFYTDRHTHVQDRVREKLNASADFLSSQTANSPRAVGDAIERVVSSSFAELLGNDCSEYSENFARRAMADIAFKHAQRNYCVVDIKTHRTSTNFNMPNLTSVERLARFYEDDQNYFVILMIHYDIENLSARVSDVRFLPIEFIDWNSLTIGALGWGQIQIANSNRVTLVRNPSRKRWMLEFCERILSHYPREILKIGQRVSRFEVVRDYWLNKPD